jgi:hypothetical protein
VGRLPREEEVVNTRKSFNGSKPKTRLRWNSNASFLAGMFVGIVLMILTVLTFDALPARADSYTPSVPTPSVTPTLCPGDTVYPRADGACPADLTLDGPLPQTGSLVDPVTWIFVGLIALVVIAVGVSIIVTHARRSRANG